MVYSDYNVPSENMNIPQRQILQMIKEQQNAAFLEEQQNLIRKQKEVDRERETYSAWVRDYMEEQVAGPRQRMEFLENTKNSLLTEAIIKLYNDSYDEHLNKRDKIIVKNLISNFVKEQGAGNLLNKFKYQNTLVAEMGRIVQESYDRVVKSISKDDEPIPGTSKDLKLDTTIVDDFYKEIGDLDTVEASELIRNKVSDAIENFVAQNLQNKVDYMNIIDNAKQRIEDIKMITSNNDETGTGIPTDTEGPSGDQTVAPEESTVIMNDAHRQINLLKNSRRKNVFHYMVEAITKQALKDPQMTTQYVHESSVDMDGITHSAKLIYHMLEMLNTTEMVDKNYIKAYIESLIEV